MSLGPYGLAAQSLWDSGWHAVLPLPAGRKYPPPAGWTGHGAPEPSFADVFSWLETNADGNVALRLPDGVFGIDVDAYGDKPGAATLANLEAEHGPLPATWISTSRDDGVSGIRLFRVPAGTAWVGALPGIETVHSGHRYCVVAPSVHPDTGRKYRWIAPDGTACDDAPSPTDLATLPQPWVSALARPNWTRVDAAVLTNEQVSTWMRGLRGGPACPPVMVTLDNAITALADPHAGARHDLARDASRALAAFGGEGHAGAYDALGRLGAAFVAAATDPARSGATRAAEDARTEYGDLLAGAVRLAASSNPSPRHACDCVTTDDLLALVGSSSPDTMPRPESVLGAAATVSAVEPLTPEEAYAAALRQAVHQERLRRDARRALDAEDRPAFEEPEILTLRERAARPRVPVRYRIEGWQPVNSRIVFAAQAKSGKTTATGNLARSLVDGDEWLGEFAVTPVDGTVVILDFEMSPSQMDEWLIDQGIRADDRIVPVPMRGKTAGFDILDPERRTYWAQRLRSLDCGYVVLDCLRPVLDGLGLDEHTEAGRFLVAFDALLVEADVPEALVVHHMGHNGERSRGDSRIRDWPDVEWRLVKQDPDDPASPRFIAAYGRDVDQPEAQLGYDYETRHLSYLGGSRTGAEKSAARAWVMEQVVAKPGTSRRSLGEQAGKDGAPTRTDIFKAVDGLVAAGTLQEIDNPHGRGRLLYRAGVGAPDAPEHPGSSLRMGGAPPYIGRTTMHPSGASLCPTCGEPLDGPPLADRFGRPLCTVVQMHERGQ